MAKKEEFLENIAAKLFEKYKVGERDLIFELINPRYGDHKHLKGKFEITHNSKKYHFRYAPAFESPFVKDQKSEDGKALGGIEVRGVTFQNRKIFVSKNDLCLQKFLLMHPWCSRGGNEEVGLKSGKLFDIYDEDAKRAVRLEKSRLKRQANVLLEKNYKIDKLAPVAIVLQPENSSIVRMGLEQLEEIIVQYIERDAQKVIDAFDNDEADMIYQFNKAVALGVITVDNANSKVTWRETGGKIFDIPQGVSAYRRWITFVNTKDGQVAYEAIKEQFND